MHMQATPIKLSGLLKNKVGRVCWKAEGFQIERIREGRKRERGRVTCNQNTLYTCIKSPKNKLKLIFTNTR